MLIWWQYYCYTQKWSDFFFFWHEFDTCSLFKFSTTLTLFRFLPFTFSLNANFHQSIFSKCKVNSLFFRLRTGMVYVVKRTNKGLCKIRLKGVDYGNTPWNDGVIIRTAGKALLVVTKNCLDPFSNIWYQLGFRLKDPSTDSRAKQDWTSLTQLIQLLLFISKME